MLRAISLVIVTCTLFFAVVTVSSTGALQEPEVLTPPVARGRVYHDANGNQQYDDGEELLGGVRVSNGREIVSTSESGEYELPVDDDTILFVIKPRGWRTPIDELNLPRFYYIHKPAGSPMLKYPGVPATGRLPNSVDFPLYPQDEPEEFKAVLFGDPQPRDQKEVDYIAHDVVEELIGTDASFGVTLGDIVFDDLDVFESINRTIALIGIPWYNVIGNHDINYDAPTPFDANETFERTYGPSYYSFDYGAVHFLVLDDIEWVIPQKDGKAHYRGGIGERQLKFIETDLAQIPEDQMVVLMMHIPITGVHDRHGLYRLIENRPFCISISGHTHTHEHVWLTDADGWNGPKPHHHIVNVTVSGSWWGGSPDERGIPHSIMSDGAPNGYSVINFDGADYRLDFHAAGRGADYQMEIDAPELVTQDQLAETYVFANVFNADQFAHVTMQVGTSDEVVMQKSHEADPKLQRAVAFERQILEHDKKLWKSLPSANKSTHLWKAPLPADLSVGTHRVTVVAIDRHGRRFQSHRILRVALPQPEPQE